jgi:serine/threonine protein kinase
MIGPTISHGRILAQLGEGGMGGVYRSDDPKPRRRVVLNFLAPAQIRDHGTRVRFDHEAEALGIAHQAAGAPAKAHRRDPVHRDIKPANISSHADQVDIIG